MRKLALLIVLAGTTASVAGENRFANLVEAEDDPVPTVPGPFQCPGYAMPEWTASVSVRDSYKVMLLQTIQSAIWTRNVERAGNCGCEHRSPTWDEANLIYHTLYAHLDQADQTEQDTLLNESLKPYRDEVSRLCRTEHRGNEQMDLTIPE